MSNSITNSLPEPFEFDELRKTLAELARILPSFQASFQAELLPAITQIVQTRTESFRSINELIQSQSYISTISNIREMVKLASEDYLEKIHLLSNTLPQICSDSAYNKVFKSLERSLPSAVDYMTPDQQQTVSDIFPEAFQDASSGPVAEKAAKRKWSRSDLLSLLGIIVALITAILAQLPDKQLDLLAEQNDIIIQQNEQMIETQSEALKTLQGLLQSAQDINDVLDDLTQDVNDLPSLPDSSTDVQNSVLDSLNHEDESDDVNSQGHDGERLDDTDDAE